MRSLRRIFNIGSCARLCESNPSCCSFEYSKTTLRCNLNSECEPDEQKYLDYDFCGRGNHIHIDADWSWLILIDSDWCLQILIYADWCWLMLKTYSVLQTTHFAYFQGKIWCGRHPCMIFLTPNANTWRGKRKVVCKSAKASAWRREDAQQSTGLQAPEIACYENAICRFFLHL